MTNESSNRTSVYDGSAIHAHIPNYVPEATKVPCGTDVEG